MEQNAIRRILHTMKLISIHLRESLKARQIGYIRNLAKELVIPHLNRRLRNTRLPRELRLNISRILQIPVPYDVRQDLDKQDLKKPAKKQKVEHKEREQFSSAGKSHTPDRGKSPVISTEGKTTITIPEEEDLPLSPEDEKDSIKQKFLVEMPDDFYSFWSFCKSLSLEKPEDALKDVGLQLVGPYDILSGKLKNVKHRKLSLYLIHWRYYFDPPEFQTVVKGDDTKQYHMGYFRDDPHELPCFVASNSAAVDCSISPMAENIFGAVNSYLETMKEKSDPFRKIKITKLQSSLQLWAKKHDFDLGKNTEGMKRRNKMVVSKTFHKAGIVVPVEKKTELGYRELMETDKSKNEDERDAFFGKLEPIVTAANIANDECDFGTSLELGIDLFAFGGEVFHRTALHLLQTAYSLLQRNEYGQIAEAHLKNRRKGTALNPNKIECYVSILYKFDCKMEFHNFTRENKYNKIRIEAFYLKSSRFLSMFGCYEVNFPPSHVEIDSDDCAL
ncbi:hypothetical protein C0J52_09790 [Blattella germanica]|nr:hypothetical protein C0J52_09790 [Blattella germanica]